MVTASLFGPFSLDRVRFETPLTRDFLSKRFTWFVISYPSLCPPHMSLTHGISKKKERDAWNLFIENKEEFSLNIKFGIKGVQIALHLEKPSFFFYCVFRRIRLGVSSDKFRLTIVKEWIFLKKVINLSPTNNVNIFFYLNTV